LSRFCAAFVPVIDLCPGFDYCLFRFIALAGLFGGFVVDEVAVAAAKVGVTRRQNEVLSFINKYCLEYGYSPSYQEIADALGIGSKSGVKRLVDGLIDRGRLEMLPRRSRSMVVS
jgi:hypothetical protein